MSVRFPCHVAIYEGKKKMQLLLLLALKSGALSLVMFS